MFCLRLCYLCVLVVLFILSYSQDIRFIGGLSVCMPFTSSCLMVSNFAVCGMQFCPVFILGILFWRCLL